MRFTTPLLGAASGGVLALVKGRDPWKYIVWGGGIGLLVTLLGGASLSVGGISVRVGAGTGTDVFKAQMMLGQLGYHVEMDGVLGPQTTTALKSFQATYALARTDGSVNPETLSYLSNLTHQANQPQLNPDTGLHSPGISYQI